MGSRTCELLLTLTLVIGCAGPRGASRPGTDPTEDITLARQRGLKQRFPWVPFSPESFAKARAEGRFILLDGAAEWCHWCHVMDETTYADPEVGALLASRFVAIRVDIDQRPDIAARYEDWGWPATVLFTPDAAELGKYRGYLPPERLKQILEAALESAPAKASAANPADVRWPIEAPAPAEALGWVGTSVAHNLDGRYDREEGGWGGPQKTPLSANVEWELLRCERGDQKAGERAAFTLRKQRPLLDPVWGGVYQYSVGGVWTDPHFEKLMPVQAAAIEALARAARVLKAPEFSADAARVASYIGTFLRDERGAFLVSQDADVGAHDEGDASVKGAKPRAAPFIDGHVYYAKDDAGRRKLGLPRIDRHVYARENGLAIAALAALYEVTRDPALLDQARGAAALMQRTHLRPDGGVRREAGQADDAPRFLADAAALTRGLLRLSEACGDAASREAGLRAARALVRDFGGGAAQDPLFASTPDPAAVGVFARRAQPFAHNVLAARALLLASKLSGDEALASEARRVLRAIATPSSIANEGRVTGELLLALAEAGAFVPPPAPDASR